MKTKLTLPLLGLIAGAVLLSGGASSAQAHCRRVRVEVAPAYVVSAPVVVAEPVVTSRAVVVASPTVRVRVASPVVAAPVVVSSPAVLVPVPAPVYVAPARVHVRQPVIIVR